MAVPPPKICFYNPCSYSRLHSISLFCICVCVCVCMYAFISLYSSIYPIHRNKMREANSFHLINSYCCVAQNEHFANKGIALALKSWNDSDAMYDDVRTLIANGLKCLHKSVYVYTDTRAFICVHAMTGKRRKRERTSERTNNRYIKCT